MEEKQEIVSQNAINVVEYIEKVDDDDQILEVLIALTTATERTYDDEYVSEERYSDALHARLQRSSEERETHHEEDVLFVSKIGSNNETLDCDRSNCTGDMCFR